MADSNLDITRLSSRISALEKANRRWMVGSVVLLVFLVATALLTGFNAYAQRGKKESTPGKIVAREFVLMGPTGKVRGRMSVLNGEPFLHFYTSDGRLYWSAPSGFGVHPAK